MGRTFKFRIKGDKKAILEEVRNRAAEQGVTFEGDESGGEFSGLLLSGSYEVSGDIVALTIVQKPPLVSWKTIESRIEQFFS